MRAGRPWRARLAGLSVVLVAAGWGAAPALAGWRASGRTTASIAYNQGVSFDQAHDNFFFDGVSSATNSGLYRTDSNLVQTAADPAVIPPTREGYNHAGDLSFDSLGHRVLLPLECYFPASGGNSCGVGAIGVADPVSLRFLYYVNLDTAQIQKVMWDEISPDGRWIWTSSAAHLLVYRAAQVSPATADRQRAGQLGGLAGKDLGPVLPTSGVTGAAFYVDALTRAPRLLLALNRGNDSQIISYAVATARYGSPIIVGSPRPEITLPRSTANNESEGLGVTGAGLRRNPLGGVLDWQMLPVITPSTIFSRILSYLRVPAPPLDGARVERHQRLPVVLRHGLRLTVVCNRACAENATVTIAGRLARRLGLISRKAKLKPYVIGAGAVRADAGRPTLTISFRPKARRALASVHAVKIALIVRSLDRFSLRQVTYQLSATLSG